ncbi:uncharacterized protein LOC122282264 [Carya illinoinensis]|uniref:uncharacterized protein LOC122282264 n=1 Tax=Carya illinoinensis TaxID=32201 RepID=UPI001C725E7E|nr:uncharacterized protein LOC122282264 [Carya illinoinensis]
MVELEKVFIKEEVVEALKQMAPLKSPRLDGYGACFYQAYWSIVGEEVVLEKMGFAKRWINLMMKCVSSMNYSVLVNALINVAERIGLLRGVVVSRGGTKISYLLFADDCVIYGMAKLSEWQQIQS